MPFTSSERAGAEVYILGSCRTPIGRLLGSLSAYSAPQLGSAAIKEAVRRAGVQPEQITDVVMGNVLSAGIGQAPARQAALLAGLPQSARCSTVGKVCGSGLEAVILGARALAAGDAEFVVAGGMESMTSAPYLLPGARKGFRLGHQPATDSLIVDGLWDPHYNLHMGSCADYCAAKYNISREAQDAYAAESFRRANAAQAGGQFAAEILPIDMAAQDEGPAKVDYAKIPKLKPAFTADGTVTAANASSIDDGAAALVLTTARNSTTQGYKPLARIVSWGSNSQDPRLFLAAPAEAVRQALDRAGWTADQVDLWEVNEAFAAVPLIFLEEFKIDRAKLNVHGGAIALGHPIGASGARILVTLLHALAERRAVRGVATICIGGGEALAICIERIE